jgi:integrase
LKKREGVISEGKIPCIIFDKVRFESLVDDFLQDYRITEKKSVARAEQAVAHLKESFQGMRVTAITTPVINTYIEKRISEGAENAAINRELAALKRMFNIGAQQTPPKVDRAPHITMLKENNIRQGFFELGDFLKLREELPDYLRGFATFGYKTGWRFSEITGLKWSQVDLKENKAWLEAGTTKANCRPFSMTSGKPEKPR